jgi:hypothetical protein
MESNANRRRSATPTHDQEKNRRELSGTTECCRRHHNEIGDILI